jgi:NADH-quinone oxidoreductase subunit F
MNDRNHPKAIQVGGPLGGIFPHDLFDADPDSSGVLQEYGLISPEATRVLTECDCIVSMVRDELAFLLDRSEAMCALCHRRLEPIVSLMSQIVNGKADASTIEEIEASAEELRREAHCEGARRAAIPVLSSIRFFRNEYEMHSAHRYCPAGTCKRLIPAPCQMACPAGIDIPSYIALIAHGRYEEALDVMRLDKIGRAHV